MNKLLSRKNMPNVLIFVLAVCMLVCALVYVYKDGYTAYDLKGHWRICKYTLEGYNPYLLIGVPAPIEQVGEIPQGFSTVPWSCVFGSIFYAGFLSLEGAHIYTFAMHFAALLLLLVVLCQRFQMQVSRKQMLVLALLPCAHFSFMYSLHYGNAGGVICCLLIMAFCVVEKRPVLAGILLGLAMMKPQISAIICFTFLLNRKWKALIVAAVIVMVGWITTAAMTGTGLMELLKLTLSSGTTAPTQYLGLLNNLKYAGVNSVLILLLNVLIGCGYTVTLHMYLRYKSQMKSSSLFSYVPACIASVFWIYKNGTDYLIIAYAAVFFCLLCMKTDMPIRENIISILCVGYLEMSRCAVYLGVVLFEDNLFVRDLFKSADGLVIGLIGIYLCILWVRYNGEAVLSVGIQESA